MVASLVGDPARSNMLTALMTGRALTGERAGAPGRHHAADCEFTPRQARGRWPDRAGETGASPLLPSHRPRCRKRARRLAGLAERAGHTRVRTGPKEPALRRARICYDHLAGDLGVQMLDSMRKQKLVRQSKQAIELTSEGKRSWRRRCRSTPTCWPIRAARCARPASTGASAGTTSPARLAPP